MYGVYMIICAIFGLAYAIPTNFVRPLVLPNENSVQNNLISVRSSNSHQVGVPLLEDQGSADLYSEYHDVMELPPSSDGVLFDVAPLSPYDQDILPMNYALADPDNAPEWKTVEYPQSLQESNQLLYDEQEPTKVLMDLETNNYDDEGDDTQPNPVLPLESLPNIYSTYVHEDLPSLETLGGYDINVLNPKNTEYLPANVRPTRSRGDDFMTELAHDTIMNNIIPTMSFVRGAEDYSSYPALQTAIYRNGAPNGCGLPILLNCNPNLIRGTLASSYGEHIPPVDKDMPFRGDLGSDSIKHKIMQI